MRNLSIRLLKEQKRGKGLYLFVLSMVLILILSSFPLSVSAEESTYGVGASTLIVRSQPDIQSNAIGYIKRNTVVTVSEKRFGWAKIDYNGQTGWVASQFLYPTNKTATESPTQNVQSDQKVTVNASGVRIRKGPGVNYAIRGFANSGDVFSIVNQQGQWVQVRLNGGGTGWIAGWLVSSSANNQPTGQQSLKGYSIVLDAGHGGFDPGATAYNGLYEKTLTIQMAQAVAEQLREAGATVVMTRSDDSYVTLANRVSVSGSYPADAFVSIHYNASPILSTSGITTYYYDDSSQGLAQDIQQELAQQTGLPSDGVRFGDYYVLRNNPEKAILMELGFISNPNDLALIQTAQYRSNVANAVTQGLMNYFGK
ncbi:N-acetylmuramoyl-L-alanine amidase [Pullulanibacillus pueri]|uniref:N-acetylmuramoyl-L-alanine amidase n=1 Tax=Pullulanibacillus pueri TaxID=1437324 RepID=UPI0016696BFE|nr:N-acetylmuramoyl-L-alanine amidase [Pullulanibacillus pueri]